MPSPKSASFASDDAGAVARLVEACSQTRLVSHVPMVERLLVPYFDNASEQSAAREVKRKLVANSGRKSSRSGSPATAALDMATQCTRPIKVVKGVASVSGQLNLSVRRSSTGAAVTGSQPVAIAACPAIFKSPKPSDLPMPSTALMRRFSYTGASLVSALVPPMAPLVLPMMVAAA